MLRRACLSALLTAFLSSLWLLPANAARLDLLPLRALPGQTIAACAVLSDNRDIVALQVDLAWDEGCLFPTLSGATHQCWTSPSTGKSILARLHDGATRIVLIALNNPRPIPDGEVFCCSFDVADPSPPTPCWLDLVGASGSDASGRKIGGIAAQGTVLSLPPDAADVPRPALPVAPAAPAVPDSGLEIPAPEEPEPEAPVPGAAEDEGDRVPATTSFVPPTPNREAERGADDPAPALPLGRSTPGSLAPYSGSEEGERVREDGAEAAEEEEEPTAQPALGTPTRGSTPTRASTQRPAGTATPRPLETTATYAPTKPATTPTAPVR